jgi:hypothetical protein
MDSRSITRMMVVTALAGCAPAGVGEVGRIADAERERLRSLGIDDVRAEGDGFDLFDEAGALVGTVTLDDVGGYDAELNGEPASLRVDDASATWTCSDGYVGSAPLLGDGLIGWLASDPNMTDGPCVASLAAGWIVSGIFKTPPEGCRRVVVDGEARLDCVTTGADEGRVASPLLAPCGGGGGGGGWGDECTDGTGWCSPACSSCFTAFGTSAPESSICEPGGGGGGGGPICGANRTFRGSDGSWSTNWVDPTTYCSTARSNAERQCQNGYLCSARVVRTNTLTVHCNDYSSTETNPFRRYYCFCEAEAECAYSVF